MEKKKTEIADRVWNKIFPFKKGDRVKVIKDLSLGTFEGYRKIGKIGTVVDADISLKWKKLMTTCATPCYALQVLAERMVSVKFKDFAIAFRVNELEKVDEDEEETESQ